MEVFPPRNLQFAGISVEESQELHKSADKDGDGEMSLSEFVASPAVEKVASNLPRPVAPARKPVNRSEPNTASFAFSKFNIHALFRPKMWRHSRLLGTPSQSDATADTTANPSATNVESANSTNNPFGY